VYSPFYITAPGQSAIRQSTILKEATTSDASAKVTVVVTVSVYAL
jgi:hypothetical protein